MVSLLLLFTALISASVRGTEPEIGKLSPELQGETVFLNAEYLVYSPAGRPEGKLPMLIYLHGAGGLGDEIRKIRGQSSQVVKGIDKFGKGPCLVVAPQCRRESPKSDERGTWIPEDLNILLQHLKASLPVDEKRTYLTGNSMGGYGSWVWGGNNPEHFAAIVPVVGGIGRGGPKDVTPDLDKWAANLAKVPVYAFAGGKDRVVPAERSERMVAAIRKAGGKLAKIKVFPEEGHGVGRLVWSNAEVYDWMFAQMRE
jgi:predicted peptidase